MKQFLFIMMMMTSFAMSAHTSDPIGDPDKKIIKVDESAVVWTGKKVTGQHTGTITIKSGNLDFENGAIVGGMISIDMNSIKCTDLGEGGAAKLEGHLKSDDFFGVENYPTAELTNINSTLGKATGTFDITADLTIKGITKPITFTAKVSNDTATGKIVIDRTDFNVRYGSGSFFDDLGDKTIYDDFELDITIKY